jgi:hypothetical protein
MLMCIGAGMLSERGRTWWPDEWVEEEWREPRLALLPPPSNPGSIEAFSTYSLEMRH